MRQSTYIHKFENGLTLVAEPMDFVASAAVSILLPTGAATDPAGKEGAANLLAQMLSKGAGAYNSRELSEEFENLGIHYGVSSGLEVTILSAAMLGENLPRSMELIGMLLREPTLPEDELESIRQLTLQELRSLEDEPSSKVMVELAKQFYPAPFGRSQIGTEEGVRSATIETMKSYFQTRYAPSGAIIGVAGRFDWGQLLSTVTRCFESWSGTAERVEALGSVKRGIVHHLEKDTSQQQIALAYPSVSFDSPFYYAAKVGVSVLSGGMAGRLFVEVREKRGLVYRVSASHSAAKSRAAVFCYAGTTPERAAETLEVTVRELRKLKDGIQPDELERAKADLKSKVIIQSESSSVRASSIVNDWWNLGRVRSIDEIRAGIVGVTSENIAEHMQTSPVDPITLVTLGPKPLPLPDKEF